MNQKSYLSSSIKQVSSIKIQKVFRGYLTREKLFLSKRNERVILTKKIKTINLKPCFISISLQHNEYWIRIYQIFDYYEFTLILPALNIYSASYLIQQLDYHPLKLYYIKDSEKKTKTWEIVTRKIKRIKGQIYIFHFFRKENSNKLKVNFFELTEEKEHTTILYSDLKLENQSLQYVKKVIERRILPKITITNQDLEVKNRGESESFDAQFENSLIKIKRLIARRRMTEFSIKISEENQSINPILKNSVETFSLHTESQFMNQIPNMVKVQAIKENTKISKALISKNLTRYINPEKQAALKIQSFIRMHLAIEKHKLRRLRHFRISNMKLMGKGGKIINHVPYYILIFKGKINFFIKVRNLVAGTVFFTEITPEKYIFGYLQKKSPKLICRSLVLYNGLPVFEYKMRKEFSVNLKQTEYIRFKKYTEAISLHQATAKIQSIYKAIKLRNLFKMSPNRNIFHSLLKVDKITYHVATYYKKGYIIIELYLTHKQKNGHWRYSRRLENSEIIQKYGEINPSLLLKDLRIKNGQIIFGIKNVEQNFQLQKHSSYLFHEILTEEKFLKNFSKNFFIVEAFYRSYKNTFLNSSYSVLHFECYLLRDPSNFREISVHLSDASEALGIPMLWVHPIAYFVQKKCLILSMNKIGINLRNKKLDLNQMAAKIQSFYRKYYKTKVFKNRSSTKKKMTLRYRLSLLVKK